MIYSEGNMHVLWIERELADISNRYLELIFGLAFLEIAKHDAVSRSISLY